jgi:hypothetical protein
MTVRFKIKPEPITPRGWLVLIALGLMIAGGIMAQLQPSGGASVVVTSGSITANAGTNLNTSLLALESGGNLATVAGAVSAAKMNINISSGSIANTAFAINAGAALIGTTLPKTGCGTTVYDSSPTNLPAALTSLTTTATCIEAIYCKNLDAAAAHPITATDQSAACNSGTCNLIPPAYSLSALGDVRFPLGYVKAVGGIKWNTDAINKVTCWVEGLQ